MRPATDVDLLPHLVRVARKARLDAKLNYAQIAVHVQKTDGRTGVAESTVLRFERGRGWPADPGAMVRAYATAIGCDAVWLWVEAARTLAIVETKGSKRSKTFDIQVLDEMQEYGGGPDRSRNRRVADRRSGVRALR